MAKFRSIKNSFLGGQVSRTALGRTDHPSYTHACETLQNMIPLLSGGAYRRPGTLHQDSLVITSNYAPRLFPFIATTKEAYAVLFTKLVGGNTYAQVYRTTSNKSIGFVGPTPVTGTHPWNVATFATSISTGIYDDEIHQVQYVQSVDKLYMVHPNHKPQILSRSATDTFTIADFDSGLSGQALVNAYPYRNQNTTSITLACSAATVGTGRTLTSSAALFQSGHIGAIFVIDDAAGNIGAVQITAVAGVTSATCTVLVALGGTTAKATWWESAWSDYRGWPRAIEIFQQRLAYAGNTSQPDTIWFSQTANYATMSHIGSTLPVATTIPSGGSKQVKYPVDDSPGDGYSTGPLGYLAFRITLTQSQLDQIQWLSADKEMLIGTLSREYLTATQNGDFSISNSPVVQQSKYGSDWVPAVRIGYELIFPVASQDELKAYQYNYIDASFFAEPIQMFFDEYPIAESSPGTPQPGRRKIRTFAWDASRNTLWCLDTSGNLYGMTRDRKIGVTAWHTHKFGGYNASQGIVTIGTSTSKTVDPAYYACDGSVVSMCVVPNPMSGINDIWLVVKRTINGTVNWMVERMTGKNTVMTSVYSTVSPGNSAAEPFLVDSAITFPDSGSATNYSYTGLDTLNGNSLTGTYYSATYGIFKITTTSVTGGTASLNTPLPADYGSISGYFVLGLPFVPIIKPVRLEAGSVIGTSQAAIKGINEVIVRFYKTISAKVGTAPGGEDLSSLEQIYFNDPTAALGKSPELYTGDKRVIIPSTYDRDGYVYIEQDDPLPFTVVSIVALGVEFDE